MSAEESNAGGRRRGRRPHGQTILRGRYPNLAAALTAAGPPRSQDDIFASCIDRLIDLAGPGGQQPR